MWYGLRSKTYPPISLGHVYDKNTTFTYMNARYYKPDSANFLTPDSYTGDPHNPNTQNVYSYTGGNPVNYVDPTGHVAIAVAAVAVGAIIVIAAAATAYYINNPVDVPSYNFEIPNPSRDLLFGLLIFGLGVSALASDTPENTDQTETDRKGAAEEDVKVKDLKPIPEEYQEEDYTGPRKYKTGKSRSNLYWDPKTGRVYSIPNGGSPPQWVDDLPPER